MKVIDKTSLSSHEKFLLRGEIGGNPSVASTDSLVVLGRCRSFFEAISEQQMRVLLFVRRHGCSLAPHELSSCGAYTRKYLFSRSR